MSAVALMTLIVSTSTSSEASLFWKSCKISDAVERNVMTSAFPFTFTRVQNGKNSEKSKMLKIVKSPKC